MGTLDSFTHEFTGIAGCCQGEIVPATPVVSLIYGLVVLYFSGVKSPPVAQTHLIISAVRLTVQMIFPLITV